MVSQYPHLVDRHNHGEKSELYEEEIAFDSVTQSRQHTFRPYRCFHPSPMRRGFCFQVSHLRHFGNSFFLRINLMNCSYPTSYPASLFGILLLPRFMKPVCQFRFVFVFPVGHLVSRWCHNILTLLKDTTPLRYYQGSDSSTSHQRQRSPWFSRLTFLMFHPQPRYAPDPRFIHHRNGISVFQTSPRMSKLVANMPPNRVRSPTDHQFASGCSPPRLMATQLPSATWLWFTMARTFTVLIKRLPRRTHSWRRPGIQESPS